MRTLSLCIPLVLVIALPAVAATDQATQTSATVAPIEPFAPIATAIGDVGSLSICHAAAQCSGYSISCDGNLDCSARDRNCSIGQVGYVECDGARTYCAGSCCPCGTCGTTQYFQTSQCCNGINLFLWKQKQCTSSGWFDTGLTDCLVACDGSGMP